MHSSCARTAAWHKHAPALEQPPADPPTHRITHSLPQLPTHRPPPLPSTSLAAVDVLCLLIEKSSHPPIFTVAQLEEIIITIWARSRATSYDDVVHGAKQNARLFANLVVCVAPSSAAATTAAANERKGDGTDGDRDRDGGGGGTGDDDAKGDGDGDGDGGSGDAIVSPRNPCLVALQLATACGEAAHEVARDRLRMNRLFEAEMLLEFVASGLVHIANRDAQNATATKGFNMWRMGTTHIEPGTAKEIFVQGSVDHAAEHEARIFISQPLVYEHLHEIFWPDTAPPINGGEDDDEGDDNDDRGYGRVGAQSGLAAMMTHWCGLVAFNAASLPLLALLPHRLEGALDEALVKARECGAWSLVLVWSFPSGRFALWFGTMAVLAQLVTSTVPRPTAFGLADVGLLAYLIGLVRAELGEARADWPTYGRARHYLSDPFNLLDLLLVALLGTLLTARCAHVAIASGPDGASTAGGGSLASNAIATLAVWEQSEVAALAAWEVPAQGLLALVAWLRLLQILFVFSRSGPLLLMAIRMLDDLWQFLMLASIVVIAFACAFYVLIAHETPAADAHADENGSGMDDPSSSKLSLSHVLGLLITAAMKG